MDETKIKFSVMTPVYNVEKFLPECISSVLSQTYTDFELILVDDGSPDGSGEICESFARQDSRIKVYHKQNGGLMHTRRYALERATGDYYVFLDSDDYIEPNTLETLARYISESGADMIVFGLKWLKGKNGTEYYSSKSEYSNRLITDKREVYNIIFNTEVYNAVCRKCVSSACFDGRDYSAYYHIKNGEDMVQSIEMLENAKSAMFIPEPLYCYRVNENSITHSNIYDGYRADFTISAMILSFLQREAVFSEEDYKRLRNSILDDVCIRIKRICRYASTKAYKIAAIRSIKDNEFYSSFLKAGYHKAVSFPGQMKPGILRAALNRITVMLLNGGHYNTIIKLNEVLYLTAKKAGAR